MFPRAPDAAQSNHVAGVLHFIKPFCFQEMPQIVYSEFFILYSDCVRINIQQLTSKSIIIIVLKRSSAAY